MRNLFRVVLLAAALFVTVGVVAAKDVARFVARGDTAQEIPVPVMADNNARSDARFELSEDGTKLYYKLVIKDLNPVTQAHIHLGPFGQNGPVVAFLARYTSTVAGGIGTPNSARKIVVEGYITAADLRGPLANQPLSALVAAMKAGNTYTNVHTIVNPPGEVRGQISEKGEHKHED